MKTADDKEQEGMGFATTALNTVAGSVLGVSTMESLDSKRRKDIQDAAILLNSVANTLDQKSRPSTKQLDSLAQEAKAVKNTSAVISKIKNWINSLIKFLKSPFEKHNKEELVQTTVLTTKEVDNIVTTHQQEKENVLNENSYVASEAKLTDKSIDVVSKPNHVVNVVPEQSLSSNSNGPIVPPPPPPPMPPISQPTIPQVISSQEQPSRGDLLNDIRKGVTLKPPGERKLNELPSAPNNLMSELATKLRIRRTGEGKISQVRTGPSPRFLAEAAEFAKARIEEEKRQARHEKEQAPKIEAALRAEKRLAEAQVNDVAKVTTPNVILTPGEIPPAPPPPPPPPLNQIKVADSTTPGQTREKLGKKNKEFKLDKEVLAAAAAKLKPVDDNVKDFRTRIKDTSDKSKGRI